MCTRRLAVAATSLLGCAGFALGLPSGPPSVVTPQTSPKPVVAPETDPAAGGLSPSRPPGGGGADGPCYANCDGSTGEPLLNANDFVCFHTNFYLYWNAPFAEQQACYANCNLVGGLNAADFACFLGKYVLGCS
jgi:hypothetical protein